MSETLDQLTAFRRDRPEAAELAELVSIAAHVEPELLRGLRMTFAPQLPASAEGDLWFSPLVESFNSSGFALQVEFARELQKSLVASANGQLVVDHIVRFHEEYAPAVAIEERVTWLALNGAAAPNIERELRVLLDTMLADETRAAGVASWAARAIPRMPEPVQQTGAARLLTLAAALRLGARWLYPDAPSGELPPGAVHVVPKGPPGAIRFRREAQGIAFVSQGEPGHELEGPSTEPALVEVAWTTASAQVSRLVIADPGRRVEVPPEVETLRFRTLAGTVYELKPEAKSEQPLSGPPVLIAQAVVRVRAGKVTATGFFVSRDLVVCAGHVVRDRFHVTEVSFGGQWLPASVVVMDEAGDTAVLRLPELVEVEPVQLAAGDDHAGRDWTAFAYLMGSSAGTWLEGTVLRTGPDSAGSLLLNPRTEAVIHGSSGAPVFVDGRVIGHIVGSERSELAALLIRARPASRTRELLADAPGREVATWRGPPGDGPWFELAAREYEQLRDRLPSGPARTEKMNELIEDVARCIARAPVTPSVLAELFNHGTPGGRVVALAACRQRPASSPAGIIEDAISHPRSPFEQWTALLAGTSVVPAWNLLRSEGIGAATLSQMDDPRSLLNDPEDTSRRPFASGIVQSFAAKIDSSRQQGSTLVARQWIDAGSKARAGTGRTLAIFGSDHTGTHREFCRRLGRALAEHGWSVVAGRGENVGEEVVDGYLSVGEARGATLLSTGRSWTGVNYPTPVELVSNVHEARERMVRVATGAVAIAGGKGTAEECRLAIFRALPVLSLPWTGGTAKHLASDLRSRLSSNGVPVHFLDVLERPLEDAAEWAEVAVRVMNIVLVAKEVGEPSAA